MIAQMLYTRISFICKVTEEAFGVRMYTFMNFQFVYDKKSITVFDFNLLNADSSKIIRHTLAVVILVVHFNLGK